MKTLQSSERHTYTRGKIRLRRSSLSIVANTWLGRYFDSVDEGLEGINATYPLYPERRSQELSLAETRTQYKPIMIQNSVLMETLQNKKIIVVGGSSGISFAVALAFLYSLFSHSVFGVQLEVSPRYWSILPGPSICRQVPIITRI